jgi:hypothetical protein
MAKTAKWVTSIGAVVLGLALIILVGVWRLGLLPLLFPPPAPIGTAQTGIQNNGPAVGTQQPQQPSKTSTGADQSPSTSGITTLNSTAGPPENTAQLTKDQLRQQIDDYYTAKLQSLGDSYESQLNGLVSEAFNEYQADKKQGKDVSLAAMAFKYISEGNALEKQCDVQFDALLGEYEADLRKNNLPLDTAIKAKQEYESAKANREKELLSAAAKML